MKTRSLFGAACAALTLAASTVQAALNVLYVSTADNTEYSAFITARYPGSVWVQKPTGLTADDTVGGNLDRIATFTGVNGGAGITVRAYLQSFDLVIVGAPTSSGNLVDGVNGADWSALTKPVLFHPSVAARATGGRPGLFSGDNNVAAAAYTLSVPGDTVRVATSPLSDLLFAGTTTPTDLYAATTMDTINTIATYGTGQLIASLTNGVVNHHGLVFWAAGATNAVGQSLASNRAFLPLKTTSLADLSADGKIVLGNLIDQLTAATAPVFLPPGGVTALDGVGQVSLAWTPAAGAVSYNVKRSDASGSGYVTISASGAVTGTAYVDTTVTNGQTYYYVVSAVAATESANSSEVVGRPVAVVQPTKNILFVANANSAAYQSFATSGHFAGSTWTQKATGTTGNDVIGGDLDRVADFTGLNGGTAISVKTYLERFDLVIIGIPTTSSNFIDGVNGADWAALAKPVLFNAAVAARELAGRVGLFSGNPTDAFLTFNLATPNETVRVSTSAAANAIFAGVANPNDLYILTNADGILGTASRGSGDLVASLTDGTVNHHGIVYWNAGTTTGSATPLVLAAKRGFLPLKGGITDLGADGQIVLGNLINQLVAVSPAAPLAPTSLAATAGAGQVSLTWTASATATTYIVKRSLTAGTGFVTISTGILTEPSYLDTAVVNDTPYFYRVSAVGEGESPDSSEVTATPAGSALSPLESWRATNFPGSTATTGDGADAADFDHDGIANLVEYATDTNPDPTLTNAKVANPGLILLATVTNGGGTFLTLSYPRNPAATGLTYTVKGGADLGVALTLATGVSVPTGNEVVYTDNVPLGTLNSRRFLSLEVTP